MEMWLARDKNGSLWMFEEKPEIFCNNREWICKFGVNHCELDKRMFQDIRFENSPRKVKFTIIKEESL